MHDSIIATWKLGLQATIIINQVKPQDSHIEENLWWQMHIDKLCKKIASCRIGAIKRLRDFVQTPTLHCIYNTLIQSQNCAAHVQLIGKA